MEILLYTFSWKNIASPLSLWILPSANLLPQPTLALNQTQTRAPCEAGALVLSLPTMLWMKKKMNETPQSKSVVLKKKLSLSFVFTHCTLSLLITKPGCSMVFSSLHIKETKLKKNWKHFLESKTWWLPNYSHKRNSQKTLKNLRTKRKQKNKPKQDVDKGKFFVFSNQTKKQEVWVIGKSPCFTFKKMLSVFF